MGFYGSIGMRDDYLTPDLPTACFLLTQPAVQFKGFVEKDAKSKYFLFTPRQRAEELVLKFIAGNARVDARRLLDAYRRAKDLLYADQRTRNQP
jgi:hypothetical protein